MTIGGTHPGRRELFPPFSGQANEDEALGLAGTSQSPIAVGYGIINGDNHAFQWTPTGGIQDLGVLPNGLNSYATAISADGTVIVGEADVPEGINFLMHAFRWTAQSGMVDLGTLSGGAQSEALAVNQDGSVIVGSGSDQNGIGTAFIWTASSGMQSLLSVLQQNGVHTADKWVQLTSLVGISGDGTVMAGSGTSPKSKNFPFGKPEPFRVVLPVAK